MSVENLILEMQAVKLANPVLEIAEVLKIFEIEALRDLTGVIRNGR